MKMTKVQKEIPKILKRLENNMKKADEDAAKRAASCNNIRSPEETEDLISRTRRASLFVLSRLPTLDERDKIKLKKLEAEEAASRCQ
ncbi:unnamed protein product [Orchesella dallaii]|uniref:Uncharacterized protein n=1 Tax=Orchesella dallaii TaxID=48710 RepID=A0ABP1QEF6_9HEXA